MAHEIMLYDEIGYWGVSAKEFIDELNQHKDEKVKLRINSPGGDVFDGIAMYNAIKSHPMQVTAVVEGLAASAASFLPLASNKIQMHENSFMMIHRAWGFAVGNSVDMRELADILEKIDGTIADLYSAKTGKDQKFFLDAMNAETWMKADEAKEMGLVDGVLENTTQNEGIKDSFDSFFFQNVPDEFRQMYNLDGEETSTPDAVARAQARMSHMKRQANTAKAKSDLLKFKNHIQSRRVGGFGSNG